MSVPVDELIFYGLTPSPRRQHDLIAEPGDTLAGYEVLAVTEPGQSPKELPLDQFNPRKLKKHYKLLKHTLQRNKRRKGRTYVVLCNNVVSGMSEPMFTEAIRMNFGAEEPFSRWAKLEPESEH